MIVCIAEKPSVGRDIARVLGADRPRDGYMEGNGYQVTWTFGHLCRLLEPNEYRADWKRWDLSCLPMLPPHFDVKVSDNEGVQKQFNVIKSLIQEADLVINCGDAGQEGELIQRWVQYKAGCRKPVKRLWISSLTEEAIRDGFAQLKDQKEYQNLYMAGYMRAIGDWLLGMNATRAYTIRFAQRQGQVLSVGRVQTPTLALIVRRDYDINHFTPRTYWELKTTYRDVQFSAIVQKDEDADQPAPTSKEREAAANQPATAQPSKGRGQSAKKEYPAIEPIASKEEGEALVERLKQELFSIVGIEKKQGTEYAPKLFDLTSLQVECNKKFSLSAEQTLQTIQSLYEKKVTTYPRVDTTYLSDDIYPKVPATLKGISSHYPTLTAPLLAAGYKLPKSKKVFDNSKVTDHHAIIPTGQLPNNLTAQERQVYDLVVRRFIAAFYPDCKVASTQVTGQAGEVYFRATGRQIVSPGWRVVFGEGKEGTDGSDNSLPHPDPSPQRGGEMLPAFTRGESGPHVPSLVEKQTTPPKPYTEATLLRAMETAGKTVDDETLREAMKENGIGRPSTRANIIETLFKRQYIERKGKSIYPTPTGVRLIATIQQDLLKSAELTGQWEKKLREIERGTYQPEQFLNELKQLASEVVTDVKTIGSICPKCHQGRLLRGRTAYGCSRWREGCDFRMPIPS